MQNIIDFCPFDSIDADIGLELRDSGHGSILHQECLATIMLSDADSEKRYATLARRDGGETWITRAEAEAFMKGVAYGYTKAVNEGFIPKSK